MTSPSYEAGRVVFVRDQQGPAFGVVLRAKQSGPRSARGATYEVLTETDRTARLPENRILVALSERLDLSRRRSELVARLREVHEDVQRRSRDFDLGELWDLLVDEVEGTVEWRSLAGYVLEESSALEEAAFLEALYADRLHYKPKKDGVFELRGRAEVDRLLAERRAAEERQRARSRFVSRMREAFARYEALGQQGHGVQEGSGVEVGEDQEAFVSLLKDLAIHGDDAPKRTEAVALLKEAGISYGRPEHAAFRVLVALGVWQEDEELCLLRHGIPLEFPSRAIAAAEALPPFEPSSGQYADLTRLDFVAIDDAETTERDDALAVDPDGSDVYVAIANPAEFVRPGDVLDRTAIRRGRTLYLPTRKLLMFPPALAEDKATLVQGDVRPALVFRLRVSEAGDLQSWDLVLGAVRLAHTLTYEQVDDLLGEHGQSGGQPAVRSLRRLLALAQRLRQARVERGAIVLDSPEVKVRVGVGGEIQVRRYEVATPAHLLVSEFMILVNEIAANFCAEQGLPCVYVSQDEPDDPLPDRREFPSERSWFHAVRHRLKKARIGTVPERHAALAAERYCQASSPLRRYSDLQNVMQMTHFLKTGTRLLQEEQMQQAAATAEQSAMEASLCERESKRYWLLRYLEGFVGRPLEAEVVGQDHDGTHLLELRDTLVTFRLPPSGLELGSRVRVVIERVDPRRDVLVARLAEQAEAGDEGAGS